MKVVSSCAGGVWWHRFHPAGGRISVLTCQDLNVMDRILVRMLSGSGRSPARRY
jgi:hypothetical protein